MRQILQSLGTGELELAEVPCPAAREGQLLIRTTRSLVSAGTERMLVEFGRAGWIEKARQQPDKVRQVLDKIATDGLLPTLEAVRGKLDQPLPLGYCNVGVVTAVGGGVAGSRSAIASCRTASTPRSSACRRTSARACPTSVVGRGRVLHGARRDRAAGHPARRSRRSASGSS